MQWLGAVRQQAITWASVNPVPCRHMVSLGHKELKPHKIWHTAPVLSLQWHHNGRNGVSNNRRLDHLLNRLSRRRIKKNTKAPRHWPLWGESTGDRWIPLTKGQLGGKCFRLMTSSCINGDVHHEHMAFSLTGLGLSIVNSTHVYCRTSTELYHDNTVLEIVFQFPLSMWPYTLWSLQRGKLKKKKIPQINLKSSSPQLVMPE